MDIVTKPLFPCQGLGAGKYIQTLDDTKENAYNKYTRWSMGRKGTSGLLLTENEDGSLRVEYVDYGVSTFGGGDYEVWYTVEKEDADKLRAYLNEKYQDGTLKEKMKKEFGDDLSESKFNALCRELGVEATRNSWTSFDMDDYGDLC